MATGNLEMFVDNAVINALLEAILDILDKDGKRSILKFAGREDLLTEKLPPGTSPREEFIKILDAMRVLLEFSSQILFEIGRKFSVYLDPFGSSIKDFISILNKSFISPQFEYVIINEKEIDISIKILEGKSNLLTDTWIGYFYRGVFLEAVRKSIGGKVEIEQDQSNHQHMTFKIKTENACN